jgi:hypothetical protein
MRNEDEAVVSFNMIPWIGAPVVEPFVNVKNPAPGPSKRTDTVLPSPSWKLRHTPLGSVMVCTGLAAH